MAGAGVTGVADAGVAGAEVAGAGVAGEGVAGAGLDCTTLKVGATFFLRLWGTGEFNAVSTTVDITDLECIKMQVS